MKHISRVGKIIILISVLLMAISAALGVVLTKLSAASMKTLIQGRMLDVSNTAAAMLDGDKLGRLKAEDMDTPDYQECLTLLTYFQDNIECDYIYCIQDLGDGNFAFSVDPTVKDPGKFGAPIVYTDALYQASLGTASVDQTPYEDDWGRFYSAYSPVFDSNNKVAGIVAVDYNAEWYESEISQEVWTVIVVLIFSFIFTITVASIVTVRFNRKFEHLYNEMNTFSDEVQTLVNEVTPENMEKGIITIDEDDSFRNHSDEINAMVDRIRLMQLRLGERISVIKSQAYFDSLTGLKNRTAYENYVQLLNENIASVQADFTVVVFDINQLKTINDQQGHEEGDRIIIGVADALKRVFGIDGVFRIGGDEFVAILDGTDPTERMHRVKAMLPHTAISMGFAFYSKEIDKTYSTVFKRADESMYVDKKMYYATHKDRRRR